MKGKTMRNILKARDRASSINTSDRVCRVKNLPACRTHVAARSRLLKDRLAQSLTPGLRGQASERLARQAVTEAEALAWSTPYPLLFLPVLVEEKLTNARQWADRQQEILERQKTLATAF